MYEVLDKGMKYLKFCCICLWQNVVMPQKTTSRRTFNAVLSKPENRLPMVDYFCVSMMLPPSAVGCMPCNPTRWRL